MADAEKSGRSKANGRASLGSLTDRQVEVLRLLGRGLTDAQIANELFLSPRTVHAHVRAIYGKLRVSNRSAATRYAIENGLV